MPNLPQEIEIKLSFVLKLVPETYAFSFITLSTYYTLF